MTLDKKDIALAVMALMLGASMASLAAVSGALRWQQNQCLTKPEADRLLESSTRITDMADFCLRTRMPIEQSLDEDEAAMPARIAERDREKTRR